MDMRHDVERLLDRIGVLHSPCDLDLLVFLARHPLTLMASEQLSAFLGYGVKKIAISLDILVGAGFVTRTPNPAHAARMYVFSVDGPSGEWLSELLRLASARQGRLAMISAMRRRGGGGTSGMRNEGERAKSRTRPPVVLPIPRHDKVRANPEAFRDLRPAERRKGQIQ